MKDSHQEGIKFLIGYCRFLSQELEKVKKESQDEIIEKQQEIGKKKKEIVDLNVLERWKIGKFLHDNLAQKLVYAKILANSLKTQLSEQETDIIARCDEIIEIINESAQDVRNLSHNILPIDVNKEGILQAFNYLKQQAIGLGVNCELELGEIIHKVNRRQVATNLYHIAQEAIKNAIVHGEADNIKIAIFEHKEQLYLHVKDDGKGLDISDRNGVQGMGITIMEYRAEEMGGHLKIRSAKASDDYNTYVTCTVPKKVLSNT